MEDDTCKLDDDIYMQIGGKRRRLHGSHSDQLLYCESGEIRRRNTEAYVFVFGTMKLTFLQWGKKIKLKNKNN